LELEYGFWLGNADYYRANLDEVCVIAFQEMGGAYKKEEIAQMTPATSNWRDVQIVQKALEQPTPDVAILTYDMDGVRTTGEAYQARVSTLYVKRGDAWKMAFHQQTPLAQS
jgi:hypothetical protein